MALDMAKYRRLFLEEAAEHLGEMGHALLELEKDTSLAEPIDTIFRMAHSIKSMAASLGYDSVTEVAHALEDHMEVDRFQFRKMVQLFIHKPNQNILLTWQYYIQMQRLQN